MIVGQKFDARRLIVGQKMLAKRLIVGSDALTNKDQRRANAYAVMLLPRDNGGL